MKKVHPLFLSLFLSVGPIGAEGSSPAAGAAATTTDQTAATQESPYIYPNEKARDPFIPLIGGGLVSDRNQGEEEGAFKADALELTGLLKTKTGRWAMLRGPGGEAYLVQNGKIHDSKRKPMEGFVGIVKEKSLVVIGPNNQVTELKLKQDREEKQQ